MGGLQCLIQYTYISKFHKKAQEGQCESAPAGKGKGLPTVIQGGRVKGYGIAAKISHCLRAVRLTVDGKRRLSRHSGMKVAGIQN